MTDPLRTSRQPLPPKLVRSPPRGRLVPEELEDEHSSIPSIKFLRSDQASGGIRCVCSVIPSRDPLPKGMSTKKSLPVFRFPCNLNPSRRACPQRTSWPNEPPRIFRRGWLQSREVPTGLVSGSSRLRVISTVFEPTLGIFGTDATQSSSHEFP